jgi:hypothetical protein
MTDAENSTAREEQSKETGRDAFLAGRYSEAFSHFNSASLTKAIRWFREEGTTFQRPLGDFTPTAFVGGPFIRGSCGGPRTWRASFG